MLISSVTIQNFRCYSNRITINFNTDGKITLIWGDAGYGKSSFLQFLKWMFYGEFDFGPKNDKPVFNIPVFMEKKKGDTLEVFGQIDFEHNGVKYSLSKSIKYECGITIKASNVLTAESTLLNLVNDNWERCDEEVQTKINSILPKELSKYFFLDGERARDIVLDSSGLKHAIHQLFGIETYERAISHIGQPSNGGSVLGYFQMKKAAATPKVLNGGKTVAELQADVQSLFAKKEKTSELIRNKKSELKLLESKQRELYKDLGQNSNKENIEKLIKKNKDLIEDKQKTRQETFKKIGNLFYQNYPYILLAKSTSKCSAILREKNKEFSDSINVFNTLSKPLLKEIVAKQICVCGRPLDECSEHFINNTMATMPPDSYAYQFSQFISTNKAQLIESSVRLYGYSSVLTEIGEIESDIIKLEQENKNYLDDLKRLDNLKDLIDQLEKVEKDMGSLKKDIAQLESDFVFQKNGYEILNSQLTSALKSSAETAAYDAGLDVFRRILYTIQQEKKRKELLVRKVLDDCVRDIFSQLTTQDVDPNSIKFINDDFSLRTTYLTGGQLAVDEYSYVIGIVKALGECNVGYNESPIIVDAPFAFTGNEQSQHIFNTLPKVSKQTVLLTLDINKIGDVLMNNPDNYDFYIIQTESNQMSATIKRGSLDDVKQILKGGKL